MSDVINYILIGIFLISYDLLMKYQHPFYTAFTVKLLNAYERGKRIFAELIIMNRGATDIIKKIY